MGADLLVKGGWKILDNSSTSTTVSGSSSTKVKVDVASASGFAVGQGVIFETGNGTGFYESRRITEVNTSATPDYIKVEPALAYPGGVGERQGQIAISHRTTRRRRGCVVALVDEQQLRRPDQRMDPDSLEFR